MCVYIYIQTDRQILRLLLSKSEIFEEIALNKYKEGPEHLQSCMIDSQSSIQTLVYENMLPVSCISKLEPSYRNPNQSSTVGILSWWLLKTAGAALLPVLP